MVHADGGAAALVLSVRVPRMTRPWRRLLWGVEFSSGGTERPLLIGESWHSNVRPESYPGEPTRALLFTTRSAARAWCARKLATYAGQTDSRALWRFRPIRVRETVVKAR